MANGIRLSRLRKQIAALAQPFTPEQLQEAWRRTPASGVQVIPVDTKYRALPKPLWDDVLQHLGIGEFSYRSERADCDDFAFAVRGRAPLELRVNGVGAVLDFGGKHAYNALVYTEGGGFHIGFIEPQGDTPAEWWVDQPGAEGSMYDLDWGMVLF